MGKCPQLHPCPRTGRLRPVPRDAPRGDRDSAPDWGPLSPSVTPRPRRQRGSAAGSHRGGVEGEPNKPKVPALPPRVPLPRASGWPGRAFSAAGPGLTVPRSRTDSKASSPHEPPRANVPVRGGDPRADATRWARGGGGLSSAVGGEAPRGRSYISHPTCKRREEVARVPQEAPFPAPPRPPPSPRPVLGAAAAA